MPKQNQTKQISISEIESLRKRAEKGQSCINNINPFDYLISIMKNKKEVRLNPSVWLPWNYHLQNSKVA